MAYAILNKEYEGSISGSPTKILNLPNMTVGTLTIVAFKEIAWGIDIPDPNLKIELMSGERVLASGTGSLTFQVKGSPFMFTLVTGLKLRISGGSRYVVKVKYPSAKPLLTKDIPLAFFKRAFDEFWNKRVPQPLSFASGGGPKSNQILIHFAEDLAAMHNLQPIELNLGTLEIPIRFAPDPNLYIQNVKSKSIQFSIVEGTVPVLTVEASFENIHIAVNALPDVTFNNPVFKIQFKLVAKNGTLYFAEPIAKMTGHISINNWCDDAGDGTIRSKVQTKIKEALEKVFNTDSIGKTMIPWLLGEQYTVTDLKCAAGNMVITYLGTEVQPPVFSEGSLSKAAQPSTDNLKKIDHIVVLMMENRSFDHMLGYLKKDAGRTEVEGLTGNEANVYKGKTYKVNKLTKTQMDESPCHDFDCVAHQMEGNMGGFVKNFAERYEERGGDLNKVMGYYGKSSLPVYDYLAKQYAICDRWFCAHPGPTWCNRFVTVTGALNVNKLGKVERDNPEMQLFTPLEKRTIFDDLSSNKVTWKYFEHGYSFIRLFTKYTFDITNVLSAEDPEKGFFAAAKKGTLPSVTFLDPDFIDFPPGNDDHPPSDLTEGQHFIGKVVKALENSPQWAKTMLIITYDEHGGFYDHVLPPNDAPPISGITQYGPRVPTFIVSPLVKKGAVAKETFDHSSILATICRRFLPNMSMKHLGERARLANDVGSLLTELTMRTDLKIGDIPPTKRLSKAAPKPSSLVPDPDSTDFHELLFFARILLGYPPHS